MCVHARTHTHTNTCSVYAKYTNHFSHEVLCSYSVTLYAEFLPTTARAKCVVMIEVWFRLYTNVCRLAIFDSAYDCVILRPHVSLIVINRYSGQLVRVLLCSSPSL